MRAEFRAVREVVIRVRESLSGVMWNWLVVSEMSWGGRGVNEGFCGSVGE